MDEQRLGVAKLTKIIKDIEAGCWRYSYFARLALDLRDTRSRIATLKRDLAAAQAEVVEARDMLADVRWVQPAYNGSPSCSCCGQQQHLHNEPCAIDRLLLPVSRILGKEAAQ